MSGILLGLGQLCQPIALLGLLGGVVIGLIVGSLPGLNDSITMAVLIPITFGMEPQVAICLLVGIYCASACGGSVPSILLKIPGTASATVTAYDGYPMTQKGKSGEALGLAISSSTFGGLTSAIVLLFLSPFLAKQALKFGPPEYFMLAVLGMSTVIGMAGDNIVKNVLAMAVGLIFSCIGMSPQTGLARFTFGQVSLMDGISLIPMLIGLFGITSILEMIEGIKKNPKVEEFKESVKENYQRVKVALPDRKMAKRLLPIWIQSSFIGNIIGIIPGAGMIMAIFMAYDQASRRRPNLEFGTGVPEGIAAPEAANNAVVASSMVPLLSLGVPLQIGAFLLPILFAKFREAYPEIKLEIQENGAYDIVKSLLDDQLDMAILSIDSSRKWDVEWTHLYNSQFCFCVGEGHPLAKRESITFSEACRFPVVVFKEGFYVNDRVRERIHECGVAPEIRMETGQLHTIKSMVLHGGCGAFLLQEAVRLDESIRAIPLDPPLEAEIGLITRKGKVIYEDAKTLIRFVKEELQEKLTENNGFL